MLYLTGRYLPVHVIPYWHLFACSCYTLLALICLFMLYLTGHYLPVHVILYWPLFACSCYTLLALICLFMLYFTGPYLPVHVIPYWPLFACSCYTLLALICRGPYLPGPFIARLFFARPLSQIFERFCPAPWGKLLI